MKVGGAHGARPPNPQVAIATVTRASALMTISLIASRGEEENEGESMRRSLYTMQTWARGRWISNPDEQWRGFRIAWLTS